MVFSENVGSFLIGEKMTAIARQIHPFNNNPILYKNRSSAKIKSFGGKKALCIIDKEIRTSKICENELKLIKSKISVFLEGNTSPTNLQLLKTKEDFLQGEEIICESECCGKTKQMKKLNHFSASHSATLWNFEGDCCISYVNLEFRHLRNIRLK